MLPLLPEWHKGQLCPQMPGAPRLGLGAGPLWGCKWGLSADANGQVGRGERPPPSADCGAGAASIQPCVARRTARPPHADEASVPGRSAPGMRLCTAGSLPRRGRPVSRPSAASLPPRVTQGGPWRAWRGGRGGTWPVPALGTATAPAPRGAPAARLGPRAEPGPGLRLSLAGALVGEWTGGSGRHHPLPQTHASRLHGELHGSCRKTGTQDPSSFGALF